MTLMTSRTLTVIRRYGLLVVSGAVVGLLLHFGIVGIDAFFIEEPVILDFNNRFLRSAFSFPFLPILLMELMLTTLTLFLWYRLRQTLHAAHKLDMLREQHETRIRTLQRAMALLAQHLAQQNNQILDQIAVRREKGQQTSQAIEAASRRISEILHTLSEVSFVNPYIENSDGEGVDLIVELERRLQERN
ncbi:MAG: hypothetical protein JXO72_03965 [Vicinamibacteria bacterium]|nr:hypothetical protein [Vicinamibacteria bacterium]